MLARNLAIVARVSKVINVGGRKVSPEGFQDTPH